MSSPSNGETMLMGFLHMESCNGKHVQRLPGHVSLLDLTLYLAHQWRRSGQEEVFKQSFSWSVLWPGLAWMTTPGQQINPT